MDRLTGVGLGLRSEFVDELRRKPQTVCDFLELAPENWLGIGGRYKKQLTDIAQKYLLIAHGLSLSLGGHAPLNFDFLKQLKEFFSQFQVACYSEHLSYCSDNSGQLYDLMPIPFTEEAVLYVAQRIKQVQEYLGRQIAIENVSYYCAPGQHLREIDFLNSVLEEADSTLLLDINNVYVNSINHGYDAKEFIDSLPISRISYLHIAGHLKEEENFLIDTHGAIVDEEVWELLSYFYQKHGVYPTLLERDHNIPPLNTLLQELEEIKMRQKLRKKRYAE